mgnify:CR=1 FL=1
MKAMQIIILFSLIFLASSCQNTDKTQSESNQAAKEQIDQEPPSRDNEIRNITMRHLKNRIDYYDDKHVVLDVRTAEEFEQGALPKAQLLDVTQTEQFKETVAKLDKDKTYFVYCRSGQRSKEAFHIMNDMGFDKVFNVTGGYLEWQELQAE